jgi:Mlc titration factor MtfA (ptsG expression regulator)
MLRFFSRLLRLFRKPAPLLSAEHIDMIPDWMPFVSKLSPSQLHLLHERMALFLERYPIEGCKGLQITDAMRLIVAAQACRLRLGHDDWTFPDLKRILIYPDDFRTNTDDADEHGIVTVSDEWRSGESWQTGYVILSWREIGVDLADSRRKPRLLPARNLILHEFAHQLDFSYDLTSGIDPDSGEAIRRDAWTKTLAKAYRRLDKSLGNSRSSALDNYGAEAPAELFAVAIEACFETPSPLKQQYPELYAQIDTFLNSK